MSRLGLFILMSACVASFAVVRSASSGPALSAQTVPAREQIISVNGRPIPAFYLEEMIKPQLERGEQDAAELRRRTREDLIKREVLAQEAERQGIADRPFIRVQLALTRQYMLMTILGQEFTSKHPVSDNEVSNAYSNYVAKTGKEREYSFAFLSTGAEADAESIAAKLAAGETFEKLLEEAAVGNSIRGGDSGWARTEEMPPQTARALRTLKVGQFTASPVQNAGQFQFFKLHGVRPASAATLEEIRPRLVEQLNEQKRQAYFESLRRKARVSTVDAPGGVPTEPVPTR